MNVLIQTTKAAIIERQILEKVIFSDNYILAAIEAYDIEGSVKKRAQAFMLSLVPLWSLYHKEVYPSIFKKFIDLETGLEALTYDHASHVNHVIQEFLFGYNILTNCQYIREKYSFRDGKNYYDSDYGQLFFSWMAASLLHDIGYDIEKAPEEEAFREEKNAFWDFISKRSITDNPLVLTPTGKAIQIIEDYLLPDIQGLPGALELNFTSFHNLFTSKVDDRHGWIKYDHGVISALKYLIELDKLEEDFGYNYLNWAPNRNAALAMALHNFRYKDIDLGLTFTNPNSLLAYLLMISDEVQEWERDRLDLDSILPDNVRVGKQAKKCTDLIGMIFRSEYAFIILDHKLKDLSVRQKYEKYIDDKILLLRKHYPIDVMFPQLRETLKKEIIRASVSLSVETFTQSMPMIGASIGSLMNSLFKVEPDHLSNISTSAVRLRRLNKIANATCEKSILLPSEPNPKYRIYVDHRIEGEPYITVVFKF